MRRAGHLANGVVHVTAERASAFVAVEQRREHAERERRGHEERVPLQRVENDGTQFLRHGVLLRDLQVVLRAGRLVARRHPPVDPVGGVEPLPGSRQPVRP